MKPKTYWAGFVDGKMLWDYTSDGEHMVIPLFTRRKEAKVYFDDVRKVEIREVK